MLQAKKANKNLTISDEEKNYYHSLGFDIYRNGKLVKHGAGKTVPYEKYEKVLKELEELKKPKKK